MTMITAALVAAGWALELTDHRLSAAILFCLALLVQVRTVRRMWRYR